MKNRNDIDQHTDIAIAKGKEFVRNTEAYYELKILKLLSISISIIVNFILVGALLLTTIILLANSISNYYENESLGYLVAAVFTLTFSILIYALRQKIQNSVIKILSKKINK